jgi:hypothetical protein
MAKVRERKLFKKDRERRSEEERDLIFNLEDEWLASRMRGDIDSTLRLLDDDYQGTTSDGVAQTKMDFVHSLELAGPSAMSSEHVQRSVRTYADVAVSMGCAIMRSAKGEHSFCYLRVYNKKDGEWRLIASQSTRLQ